MVTKAKKRATKKHATPVDAFILLDRSGSMTGQWAEAISSINAYVHGLQENGVPGTVTLALFDQYAAPYTIGGGGLCFDVARSHPVKSWVDLTPYNYVPRGGTPLYDAVARLVHQAEITMPNKAVIIIMTDGQENASTATNQSTARHLLDRCRERGWQVVFLGANFDQFAQGYSLGAQHHAILNSVPQAYGATMRSLATASANYAVGGGLAGQTVSGNIEFSENDRTIASGRASSAKAA